MSAKFKIVGLIIMATVAVTALNSTAQAAEFAGGKTPNNYTATTFVGVSYGENASFLFKEGLEFSCETVTLSGSISTGTTKSLTATPVHKDCTSSLGSPATVTFNGCDYIFNQPTGSGPYTGTMDIVCPVGKTIEIELYLFGSVTSHSVKACTVKVLPKANLGTATYTNKVKPNGEDDVTIHMDMENLSYKEEGSFCPNNGQEASDGAFNATITKEGLNQDEVWVT